MPKCESCGAEMVRRTARRGSRAGHEFWGCSNYPKCKKTVNIEEDEGQIEANNAGTGESSTWLQHTHLRARAIKSGYQSAFMDSLCVPASLLESLNMDLKDLDAFRHYSKWRIDYPVCTDIDSDDFLASIIAVAQKILMRGTITIGSSLAEERYAKLFGVYDVKSMNPWKLGTICTSDEGTRFNFDGAGTEKLFYEKTLKEFLGPFYRQHVIPQVYMDSLLNKQDVEHNYRDARVDFLITTKEQQFIVELDGEEHGAHLQRDQERDRALEKEGLKALRIKNEELENMAGEGFEELKGLLLDSYLAEPEEYSAEEKYCIAIKIHHQIMIALTELYYSGGLNLTEKTSLRVNEVSHIFSRDEFLLILKTIQDDFNQFINQLFKLYQSKKSINLKIERFEPESKANTPVICFGESTNCYEQAVVIQDMYLNEPISYSMKLEKPIRIDEASKKNLEYFLNLIFRKPFFWEGQYEALSRAFAGKDAIVLLPTGSGKSIVFQLASILMPGVTIVIDPIIALINDQVDNLRRVGIDRVVGISSDITNFRAKMNMINEFSKGTYMFTYVAPERFQTISFRESLRALTVSQPISLIVIDEAHCVSEWGHDFRTSYLNIGRITREYCSSDMRTPPLLALTGTASNSVLRDVQRELQIEDYDAIITPTTFDRKELKFTVKTVASEEKNLVLKGFLHSYLPQQFRTTAASFYAANGKSSACGLIFCPHVNGQFGIVKISRYASEELGIDARTYAGKVPKGWNEQSWRKHKQEVATDFKNNKFQLLVATKSFGMGIDKPNIRYTIHLGIPNSIESFYQEAGRAGRDRSTSRCIVLVSNDKKDRTRRLLDINTTPEEIDRIMKNERSWESDDDITRAMFFHTKSFRGVQNEIADIIGVLDLIGDVGKKRKVNISNRVLERNLMEKALHRLLLIGIVADYTIDYANKEFEVYLNDCDRELIVQSYTEYVAGYNKGRVAQERQKLLAIGDIPLKEYIEKTCEILLSFIYDTIEKGRRRALREMLAASEEAVESTNQDEVFRNRILRYLESNYYEEVESIINDEGIGFKELRCLCDGTETETGEIVGGIRSPKDALQLRGQTARYLESYPDHPSLLYLRAISEAYASEPNKDIIRESIEAAAKFSVERYSVSEKDSYHHISWVLKTILFRDWELYLELFNSLRVKYPKKEFLRAIICENDVDHDMLYEPAVHLFRAISSEAIDVL
ncbi:RecQ family ATP-dependent DNA helicase [Clostridia bacterium]|nr:RecQ family ATP-dependent DNA helicase [Clostridia bacterium]